jgi:hypothetical protein
MGERPIIIRGGESEFVPGDSPTSLEGSTHRRGSTEKPTSLFIESDDPLHFISNADKTKWELPNVVAEDIEVVQGRIDFLNRRRFKPKDGEFEVEIDRDPAHEMHPPPPSKIKIVLAVAAVGIVAWLLSRRS